MKAGEKRSIGVAMGSVVFLLGAGLWWNHLNAVPDVKIPTPKLPKPNAFDFYVKAGQMHSALLAATPGASAVDPVTDGRSKEGLTPQQLAQRYPTASKIAWIKKNAPALKTLRQGFAYEYMEPPQRAVITVSPHYGQFRSLARLLIIESHSRSEQGDWNGASRSTLDILRMGHDVPCGGPLIGALVGYAIDAIGRREFQSILPHLDANGARAAAVEMEKLQSTRFGIAETFQEEKWIGQTQFKQFMRGGAWSFGVLPNLGGSWKDKLRAPFYSRRRIMSDHARYMDALIAQVKQPYLKRQAPTLPRDPLNKVLLPVFAKAPWNAARDEAGNCVLMVQLALRAFQLEHKRLPDNLNELTPSYLKKVPRDPFGGGEAIRYHRTRQTYLLYSIGPDGKDDGGKPIDRPGFANRPGRRYLLQPDSTGDYVAGINR